MLKTITGINCQVTFFILFLHCVLESGVANHLETDERFILKHIV